jgi:hypothetical protein
MKIALRAALLTIAIGFSSQAGASLNPFPDFTYVACNEVQCQMVSCGPNGCTVIATWPRPREISGD